MFEVEVAHIALDSHELPSKIREEFLAPRSITHLSLTSWEEHCTECAWPQCYTTCDLYSARSDGNCRRTIDGFSPLVDMPVFGGHVVRVKFKRWANLTAHSSIKLRSVKDVARIERRLNVLSLLAASAGTLGQVVGYPGLASRAVRRLKSRSVERQAKDWETTQEPNLFLMEIYNPGAKTIELSLDIAAREMGHHIPFKRMLRIEPGFHRVRIPFDQIRGRLAEADSVDVSVNPNILHAEEEGLTLYLGVMAFAHDPSVTPTVSAVTSNNLVVGAKKIKVMIWDLDNTLWQGTLIEDGRGKMTLKPGILETIVALDGRGIVNSIASKNHEADALAELERLGLREYFVFPMISWGPKSQAVRRIIQSFNVGEDTIGFIDDQTFEREEVRAINPLVRTYRHDEYRELLQRQEFDVSITEEARNRRFFYQHEEIRKQALDRSSLDYIDFLKQSNIRVDVKAASVGQIDRIHELTQRTNQMNFSGNRYTKDDLRKVLSNPEFDCFLIQAEDVYGKYGYVGFIVVRRGAVPRVVDLAFSCRVQSKRVEHGVLIFLMQRYAQRGATKFEIYYRATDKNAQIAQVFPDLGCVEASRSGADFVYRSEISEKLPENGIIAVTFSDDAQFEAADRTFR
jgi:FkbH-like protein